MTNKEIFYRRRKFKTGVGSFAMVTPPAALDCFHVSGLELYHTNSWDTIQCGRKCLSILAIMLVFSINCFAGDTTSVLLHFAFDKYSLNNDAEMQLNQLTRVASGALANIKVYGFTDQVGSDSYNKKLSVKRAAWVRDYLVKTGMHPNIITLVQGKGETQLVSDQMDKASRQQNRRVLVMIEYEGKMLEQTFRKNGNKKNDGAEQSRQETEPPTLTNQLKDGKVRSGDQIILRNIHFEGGRHVFLPRSYAALRELLTAMKDIPTLKIEIQGHICCVVGPEDGEDNDLHTQDLSVQRAKAVYDYLLENGIEATRMSYEGYGHQYPITDEQSEEDKTTNRRVEIKIISK